MDILENLKELFETQVNDKLKEHGGGARPLRIEGDTLYIQMYGHCVGCLSVDETVTGFIEKLVNEKYPEIKRVIHENPDVKDMMDFARGLMGKNKA